MAATVGLVKQTLSDPEGGGGGRVLMGQILEI